jgi:lipoyl(octanoyl) transferase
MNVNSQLIVRHLGDCCYTQTVEAMQRFTADRDDNTIDEIWLLQHPAVFTQGRNGKAEHVLDPGAIPVEQTDRGGQVTYHGPGQAIMYVLLDLQRRHSGVRQLVDALEQSVIQVLQDHGIKGELRREAPGVYVDGHKIASLGLRVKRGSSYHGLSFNVAMDTSPFQSINPCGYPELRVTQLSELCDARDVNMIADHLARAFAGKFGYSVIHEEGCLDNFLQQAVH